MIFVSLFRLMFLYVNVYQLCTQGYTIYIVPGHDFPLCFAYEFLINLRNIYIYI